MKLKEYPVSFFNAFRLGLKNAEKISGPREGALPLVVSLTSIPSRIPKVHLTIRSILCQEPGPQKVILWLNETHKNKVTKNLQQLQGPVFDIRFTHLHCSHKKLIHTLQAFPDLPVVTADDDCIYRKGWLSTIYRAHRENPGCVIAHRVRCIKKDAEGRLLPYKKWNCTGNDHPATLLPIGAEGILYPPGIFPETVFDEELFLKLAPTADDLWFRAVALSHNVPCKKVPDSPAEPIPIFGSQKVSLKDQNIDRDKNREQWEALEEYFQLTRFSSHSNI